MAQNSQIKWTEAPWNPVSGCTDISYPMTTICTTFGP